MCAAQRDISTVTTIQILDGCNRSQQLRRLSANFYKDKLYAHLEFLRAGANVIRTDTFHSAYTNPVNADATHYKLIIGQSVIAAKQAIEIYVEEANLNKEKYWILGSCGSATRCNHLIMGRFTRDQCKNYHRDRIGILRDNKVDGLAFESIETAVEAYALVELLQEFDNVRAIMSFRTENGKTLRDGTDLVEVARYCYQNSSSKIFAVGVNCTQPMYVRSIVDGINKWKLRTEQNIPVVACPDNYNVSRDTWAWQPMDVETDYPAREWARMNIRLIGGCCNTLPVNIQTIRNEIYRCPELSRV